LRWGIMSGGAAALAGTLRKSRGDSLPSRPPTTPFVLELLPRRGIPPVKQPVSAFATSPGPGNTRNPHGAKPFHGPGPRIVPANTLFYKIYTREVRHTFHPQLPQSLLWGYDGSIPGPTIVSQSGTPQLVRFINNLPPNEVGIGEPINAIHRHGGF